MVAKRGAKTRASDWVARPARLAVTIDQAAEALGVPVRDVERAARRVEPYIAAGGVPKWPIRELARTLADCGRVVGRT
jgi:hypothetical protein